MMTQNRASQYRPAEEMIALAYTLSDSTSISPPVKTR